MEKYEKHKESFKSLSGGKSPKELSVEERIKVYLDSRPKNKETPEERLDRINAFRCGWKK